MTLMMYALLFYTTVPATVLNPAMQSNAVEVVEPNGILPSTEAVIARFRGGGADLATLVCRGAGA